MKISNDQRLTKKYIDNYFQIHQNIFFEFQPTFERIINSSFDQWNEVKSHFSKDFRYFDKLLFKIHFRRKKRLSDSERYNILYFLASGYYHARDVRYFNEFLFFYQPKRQFQELWNLARSIFFTNIHSNKHVHPFLTEHEVTTFAHSVEKVIPLTNPSQPVSIGLIGNPIFFKKIYDRLTELGYNVSVYLVKYHSNKKINTISHLPGLWSLLKSIRLIPSFTTLDHKAAQILSSDQTGTDKIMVGFHKLGFIIKNDILSMFTKGLLNDHWAILPFIRGRSTIEYSILLGFEIGCTLHLVTNRIDEGSIVDIYTYNAQGITSIKKLKKRIRKDLSHRVVNALNKYISSGYKTIENNSDMGLTYYSIHPALSDYINSSILNKPDQ